MNNKFDYLILDAINNAVKSIKAAPLILGGVSGSGGGIGGPTGGFIGFLPQTRVSYDLSEIFSSGIPESGRSLLDNLNHIRYRLNDIENRGTMIVVTDDGSLVASGITTLDFRDGINVINAGNGTVIIDSVGGSGAGGGHIIQDEGITLSGRSYLNFVGSGVSVLDDAYNNKTLVTISGNNPTGLTPIQTDYITKIPVKWLWTTNYQTPDLIPPIIYNDGTGGVGATITKATNGALPSPIAAETKPRTSIIGEVAGTINIGDRILYSDSMGDGHNGIYTVTNKGSISTPWILTRATDCDSINKRLAYWQVNLSGTPIIIRRTKNQDPDYLGFEIESATNTDGWYGAAYSIGDTSEATDIDSIAIGKYSVADGNNSIAIGLNGVVSRQDEVVAGNRYGGIYIWRGLVSFGSDRSLVRSDANKILLGDNSSGAAITVPINMVSSGNFYLGTKVDIFQRHELGPTTIIPASGVSIIGDTVSYGKNSRMTLESIGSNEWATFAYSRQRIMPNPLVNQNSTSTSAEAVLSLSKIRGGMSGYGDFYRIKLFGISSSTGTLIFRVRAGNLGTTGDAEVWKSITSAAQIANQRAGFEAQLVVRVSGASGVVQCEGLGFAHTAILPTVVATVTSPTVDTSIDWYIDLTVTCSTGVFTAEHAIIERI